MQKENITDNTSIEPCKPEYWQWIKGDLSGEVVTFKDTDDSYINFNEGGRIAIDLRDEFLQPLDSDIAGELVGSATFGVDPLNISSSSIGIGQPQTKPTDQPKSPIRILFDKQKKNNEVKLILEFPINIPSKEIYELMSTSFGIDEVKGELKDFILDQLSKNNITDCLHQSVESLIESNYKDE